MSGLTLAAAAKQARTALKVPYQPGPNLAENLHPSMRVQSRPESLPITTKVRFHCCSCCGSARNGHTKGKADKDFHSFPCPAHQTWKKDVIVVSRFAALGHVGMARRADGEAVECSCGESFKDQEAWKTHVLDTRKKEQ